jgi:C1A family cysteine protease
MVETYTIKGLGYLRDYRSLKDYYPDNPKVKKEIEKVPKLNTTLSKIELSAPKNIDRRTQFTPIRDQGSLGSCTAFSTSGLVEYFEKNAFGSYTLPSTRFIYKATRNLLGWKGDTGAFMKSAMGSIALFGSPPEKYWPYDVPKFDLEPTSFCYAFGQNYQAIKYVRLDPPDISRDQLLVVMKEYIAKGLPSMFGFTCFESLYQSNDNGGQIPFPIKTENVIGGHAIVVAGYDDNKKIKNVNSNTSTTGAFLIRNSWGSDWGERGYGWLPYEYFLSHEADDVWTLIKGEWIDNIQFT